MQSDLDKKILEALLVAAVVVGLVIGVVGTMVYYSGSGPHNQRQDSHYDSGAEPPGNWEIQVKAESGTSAKIVVTFDGPDGNTVVSIGPEQDSSVEVHHKRGSVILHAKP